MKEDGADPDPLAVERDQLLVKALLRRAAKARLDPASMFEFVMREEKTRARITALPHQRLVFDFVMAHPVCVIRMPVGFSKTYLMIGLSLFFLGQDPTTRGMLISDTQGQSEKLVAAARDYIEGAPELRVVFPELRPSQRLADPWTQTKIVVDRPFGIRDPSLAAVGDQGSVAGARINWAVVDDILSMENTATPAMRAKMHRWFESTVVARLDPEDFHLVVTNTPWVGPSATDPGDLTYALEAAGIPTLTVSVWGGVWITNAPEFDSKEIRPAKGSTKPEDEHRLAAHDDPKYVAAVYPHGNPPNPNFDEEELVPLWPERYPLEWLLAKKEKTRPREWAQNYECKARAEAEDRLEEPWIERAKAEAVRLGHHGFAKVAPHNAIAVVTGVDLGVSKKKGSARTVLFTMAVLPDGRRLPLDIQAGKWSGTDIISKVVAVHQTFGSIVRVENNAAQDFLRQWIIERDATVPVRAHTTGQNKVDPRNGVESIFIEFEQGAWIVPCDLSGRAPGLILEWLQDLRQYEPDVHTGDILMACWLAREQARKQGAFARPATPGVSSGAGELLNR